MENAKSANKLKSSNYPPLADWGKTINHDEKLFQNRLAEHIAWQRV